MLNNYTYGIARTNAKGVVKWSCSTGRGRKSCCLAFVKMFDGNILGVHGIHNHPPPQYHVTQRGQYLRIK